MLINLIFVIRKEIVFSIFNGMINLKNVRTRVIVALMLTIKIVVILLLAKYCIMNRQPETSAFETIHGRTSIRSYTAEYVSDEQVEQLLRAAMAAPSSRNIQPWFFYVIRDAETLSELAESLPFAKMLASAPLAIVVCGDTLKGNPNEEQLKNWVMDCSAATQNLLLAAQAMGLGAVWTGVYPYADRIKSVRDILDIPNHLIPLNVIPVGHPADKPVPKDKWDPGKVTGWPGE